MLSALTSECRCFGWSWQPRPWEWSVDVALGLLRCHPARRAFRSVAKATGTERHHPDNIFREKDRHLSGHSTPGPKWAKMLMRRAGASFILSLHEEMARLGIGDIIERAHSGGCTSHSERERGSLVSNRASRDNRRSSCPGGRHSLCYCLPHRGTVPGQPVRCRTASPPAPVSHP